MIVITFLLKRKAGLSTEEFHRYWRDEHGPLVARHARTLGIRRYSQLHTTSSSLGAAIAQSRGCEPAEWDGVALVWFDDVDTLTSRATSTAGLAAGAALLDDERRFLDLERCQLWLADDHAVVS